MDTGNTVVDSFATQDQINSDLNTLSQKYLGNSEYLLSSTSTGLISSSVIPIAPFANLTNRYYPTVALAPQLNENIVTSDQLGGYFVPSNLGASIYLTKNIIYSIDPTQVAIGTGYRYIDPTRFNKGFTIGSSNLDSKVVTHNTNTNWMKAIGISNLYDGTVVNTDTYQKFVPYQSFYETTKSSNNGIVTAEYDFEFWEGPYKNIWNQNNGANSLDEFNYFNLNQRITNLVFTPGRELYSWCTDVFGNQYGLYKPFTRPYSMYSMVTATGALWTKTVDGTINIGPSALNLIYNNYIYDSTIYSQLTANNIVNFEVFYDTLVIQLSSTILYEKVTFDYNTYTIQKSLQNYLPLSAGFTASNAILTNYFNSSIGNLSPNAVTYYGGNWYDDINNNITICTLVSSTITGGSTSIIGNNGLSSVVVPVLYRLDLNNPKDRTRIYPSNTTDPNAFKEYVYPLGTVSYMEAPVFCYNEDTQTYVITFISFPYQTQKLNLITYKVQY
jgi:hypothetical protein